MVKIKMTKSTEELKKEGVEHGRAMISHIGEVLEFLVDLKGPESLKMIVDITGILYKAVDASNRWLKVIDKGDSQ